MLKGFKEFIARGNVIELAVGVIIGQAFKQIVDELVTDILNPAIGAIFGKPDFTKSFILHIGESQILFGALLTAIINFLLIAFAVYFFIVVPMNYFAKMRKRAQDAAPKEVSDEVKLLTEIRDALARGDRA